MLAVASNATSQLVPGAINLLLSVIVIRLFSPEWWGKIIELQLAYYLAGSILAWGNKEYLLREFSKHPAGMGKLWRVNINTRALYLLIPCMAPLFFLHDPFIAFNLFTWIASRFIVQSYESVSTYEKRFFPLTLSEVVAFVPMLIAIWLWRNTLTYNQLVLMLSAGHLLKGAVIMWSFREYGFILGTDPKQLRASSLFAILAITGFVATKIDLMIVDLLMDKKDLGVYHVVTNFFILIKTVSSFILYPFAKNIYRMPVASVSKMPGRLLRAGIVISLCGLTVQYIFIKMVYPFDVPLAWYIYGFIGTLPGFWFSPFVFFLFRKNKQNLVIWANLFSSLVNAILCILLIPAYGIPGALVSMAFSQLILTPVYWYWFKRSQYVSS